MALLNAPVFREVLNELDADYHARWRKATSPEAREDLHRYVKVLERITSDLQQIATTGKLERARQQELETGKKGFEWPKIRI